MLCAGPGRIFFTTPTCPPTPQMGLPKQAQALPCCAPVAAKMGQHGGAVVGKEGFQSWPGSAEHLTPPPVRVLVSGTQSKPNPVQVISAPRPSKIRIIESSRARASSSKSTQRELPWPGRANTGLSPWGKENHQLSLGQWQGSELGAGRGPTIQVPLSSTHLQAIA